MLIHAAQRDLVCGGIELNPELAALAQRRAEEHGIEIEIDGGDVQTRPLAPESWEVVVANSVLEHVHDYRRVLENAYAALRPGALLYFNSTNKCAFRSGEYRPGAAVRRAAVRMCESASAGTSGTGHRQLGRHRLPPVHVPGAATDVAGHRFRQVLDIYELLDVGDEFSHPRRWRALAMRAYKALPVLRHAMTTIAPGTSFYCVKMTVAARRPMRRITRRRATAPPPRSARSSVPARP